MKTITTKIDAARSAWIDFEHAQGDDAHEVNSTSADLADATAELLRSLDPLTMRREATPELALEMLALSAEMLSRYSQITSAAGLNRYDLADLVAFRQAQRPEPSLLALLTNDVQLSAIVSHDAYERISEALFEHGDENENESNAATSALADPYTDLLQHMVAEFHRVFGHPDGAAAPAMLAQGRLEFRLTLIEEELDELHDALKKNDEVEIIDALCDVLYFVLGTLVEMGRPITLVVQPPHREIRSLLKDRTKTYLTRSADTLDLIQETDVFNRAVALLERLADNTLKMLTRHGYDPVEFFTEVHSSNMSKLDENGNAIYSRGPELDNAPLGKVLKSANYFKPDLASIYYRQRQQRSDAFSEI